MMTMPYLLQTADTTDYMILGLAFIIGVILLFILYLAVRQRNLKRDLELIESLEAEDQ